MPGNCQSGRERNGRRGGLLTWRGWERVAIKAETSSSSWETKGRTDSGIGGRRVAGG